MGKWFWVGMFNSTVLNLFMWQLDPLLAIPWVAATIGCVIVTIFNMSTMYDVQGKINKGQITEVKQFIKWPIFYTFCIILILAAATFWFKINVDIVAANHNIVY